MIFNRRTVKFVSAPAPIVGLNEIKQSLKIDGDSDDCVLQLYIDAATDFAQKYIRRALTKQDLELTLDGFASDADDRVAALGAGTFDIPYSSFFIGNNGIIDLPYAPVFFVSSIKTYDVNNIESTFDESNYGVDESRIYLNQGSIWPVNLRARGAVVVAYTAGFDETPAAIKQGIRSHVQQMYECRGDCQASPACLQMYDGYKLYDEMGVL